MEGSQSVGQCGCGCARYTTLGAGERSELVFFLFMFTNELVTLGADVEVEGIGKYSVACWLSLVFGSVVCSVLVEFRGAYRVCFL